MKNEVNPRLDAYFNWAIGNDFAHFQTPDDAVFALIEFDKKLTASNRVLMAEFPGGIWISPIYIGHQYASAQLNRKNLKDQIAFLLRNQGAIRCELAMALKPIQNYEECNFTVPILESAEKLDFIGVIDDGCPFAHQDYLTHANKRWETQIEFIWDQGREKIGDRNFPVATPFGYGAIFSNSHLQAILAEASANGNTKVDEDAAYAKANLTSLRGLTSHGAHVLSHAVGFRKASSRMSSNRFENGEAVKPPSWDCDQRAKRAHIAFVQLPRDAVDDPTGRWLGRYVLDGIHMLLNCAKSLRAGRRVINVSYGPQTGPHDGSSLLEEAMDALLTSEKGNQEIFITLPTGNSRLSRAHAVFQLQSADQSDSMLEWHVAPESQLPVFCEIWLPKNVGLSDVDISIIQPGGTTLTAVEDEICAATGRIVEIVSITNSSNNSMVLIAIAPTARSVIASNSTAGPLAPSGRWQLQVKAKVPGKCEGEAHAYLSRNDFNMGGARRGHPGYFYRAGYDHKRFMRADEYRTAQPIQSSRGTDIAPDGSCSGIATGALTSVAGGELVSKKRPSTYSCDTISRGKMRSKVDRFFPSDESEVFQGILGSGNRSASVFRMGGTSVASPQYANFLAMDTPKNPSSI